uniref:Uncharacterized protein n=1 Tax=Avena sativa TaxID=4498 RepID=A0ACD5UUD4_AVESA
MASSNGSSLPVVDLAPFFVDKGGVARGRATAAVREACLSSGFFHVVNHGVPRELMARALELEALFFALPDEEKAKVRPAEGTPFPSGHARQPAHSVDKNELLLVLHPKLWLNLYPEEPAGFRRNEIGNIVNELRCKYSKSFGHITGGASGVPRQVHRVGAPHPGDSKRVHGPTTRLPRGVHRTFDFISARHAFPATKEDNRGARPHQDVGCITFVLQDGVGGLEVLRSDGVWAPVEPIEGSIVVNIGDVVQVLSNGKFRSAMHRVVRKPAAHRYSLVFFFHLHDDKWVEPLPQFAGDVGEPPRYTGFKYGEYLQLRRKRTHPPSSHPENIVDITHYAIYLVKLTPFCCPEKLKQLLNF